MRKINFEEVKDFISKQSTQSKIYIGCDSERFLLKDVWYADYITVVVVHIDGKHGGKIFSDTDRERDFDQKQNRPRYRLMNEVYRASNMYLQLADVLIDRNVEVHLDINPNENYGSSCVLNEAIGYIRGTCNVIPLVKPQSWASSNCADWMLKNRNYKNT